MMLVGKGWLKGVAWKVGESGPQHVVMQLQLPVAFTPRKCTCNVL